MQYLMTLSRYADIENVDSFLLIWSIPTQSFKIILIDSIFHFRQDFLFQQNNALCEMRLHSELFCSAFPRIRTEYGEIRSISPYSVQMRGNTDEKNSEYGHFLRSDGEKEKTC